MLQGLLTEFGVDGSVITSELISPVTLGSNGATARVRVNVTAPAGADPVESDYMDVTLYFTLGDEKELKKVTGIGYRK